MTTHIHAHCPGCHTNLTLEPSAVLLRLGPGRVDAGYRFICRECLARVDAPANPHLVSVLMSIGVPILEITEEPTAVPDAGEPITESEALDFAIALAGTDTPQAELDE
jgi:hypothetical protein